MRLFFFSPALLLLTALVLLGCKGKSVDPLAQDRARLLALSQSEVFHQDAVLMLSPDFLQEQIQREVDAQLLKKKGTLRFEAGQGATFLLSPNVRLGAVSIFPASNERVHVRVPLAVSIAVGMEGGLPLPLPPLTLTATLDAMLGVRLEGDTIVLDKGEEGDGLTLEELQWGDVGSFLPAELKTRVEREVEKFLNSAQDGLALFKLPNSPVVMQNIRARSVAGVGVAVDFSFALLEHSQATEVPRVERGALLVLPEKTLFELTRAVSLMAEPVQGRTFEPAALALTDNGFVLDLRVWTMSANPSARTYRSESLLSVRDRTLRVESLGAAEVGEGADDGGPLRWFERTKILESLEESLSQVVTLEGDRFEVTAVEREGSALMIELQSAPLP